MNITHQDCPIPHLYTEEEVLKMLIQAAQYGSDFQSANADTIKYDTIEEMVKDRFININDYLKK